MSGNNQEIKVQVPLQDFVKEIACTAAKHAVKIVIEEHEKKCRIGDIKLEVWGNGRPGLKEQVHDLVNDRKRAAGIRGFFIAIAKTVFAALIVTGILYGVSEYKNRAVEKEKIIQIIKEIEHEKQKQG